MAKKTFWTKIPINEYRKTWWIMKATKINQNIFLRNGKVKWTIFLICMPLNCD